MSEFNHSKQVTPILKDIMNVLEQFAPLYLAESWDNVGLMVGSKHKTVNKVLCALDLNEEVIEEAIMQEVDCIITHHPFLFKALKRIDLDSTQGAMLEKLIANQIAVYSMHTNYDITWGGLNDELAHGLGLQDIKLLETTYEEQLYKCVIYVPLTHYESVREAIVNNMTTQIGDYSGCTFTSGEGEGTFIPLEGSNPYIGKQGIFEKVKECQVSFMGTNAEIQHILQAVKKVHPYEEVAIDVFELKNMKKQYGIGRYGRLEKAVSLDEWIQTVKAYFKIDYLRVTDPTPKMIQTVAICSGAGSSFIGSAARVADVYITGDLKFHEGQMAKSLGLVVLDVGHYASEHRALEPIGRCIEAQFKNCQVLYSKMNGETLWTK
ncbi:MAG: Nif3-like dinuclear metal center hexameric protein [Cellulosilyticum sp.]|nr:Nif3-like dinuclear metal center hexameric protein [Cellulosilyticum sp.]